MIRIVLLDLSLKLEVGANVMFKKMRDSSWIHGTIVDKAKFPRSYVIRSRDGKTYRRNSSFIKLLRNYPVSETRSAVLDSDNDSLSDVDVNLDVNQDQNIARCNYVTIMVTNLNGKHNVNGNNYVSRSGRAVRKPARYIESC